MKDRKNIPAPPRQEVAQINADPAIGLTSEQVQHLAACGWSNHTSGGVMRTDSQIIAQNCLTFFNLVFVILAGILLVSGSTIKNMTFLVVVVVNTVIGCIQEIRAKRAVAKLTLVAQRPVRTMRDGAMDEIRSEDLVRDDIVFFGPGDQICADGILRTGSLQVNESLVTGEADAIQKVPGDLLRSGSFVVAGRGKVQLTQVGDDAFAAKLALEAKADPRAAKSEMMRSLDRLIQVVGIALIPVGIALFWQEFRVLEQGFTGSAESTVAALVGMIPEGLYLLTSIAMAASAIKLTQRRVLVQEMNCIETLARVDVLCVDKTGTITESHMEVENVVPLSSDPPEYLEAVLTALYSGQDADNDTGRALQEMFAGESSWHCLRRIPFTSQSKWSGAVFEEHGAFLVGAPEFILGSRYDEIREQAQSWSSTGYRVLLAAGYQGDPVPGKLDVSRVKVLALLLLTNRIRPQAPDTFRYFVQQGVDIKVISGDNPATVSDVASRAGIAGAERYVDTEALETPEDFQHAVSTYTVFGRVTPDKKRELIRALRRQGHTVAMTGDGVNDVLAMRESNCAIAMAGGAQAASQVAQLVLLDSDFSVMPGIVGEGRRVINNIQRAATLFLVKNIFSLGLALLSLLTGWPYPLAPMHLTVISALTIGFPSFFLAMEPNYERVKGNFLRGVLRRAFPGGLTNIFVVLAAQAYGSVFGLSSEQVSTISTAVLSIVGLLVLFQVCKPFDRFRKLIWGAVALGLLGCFTLLGSFFELQAGDLTTVLVMLTLMIMTPTVFFAVQRCFDWGDKLCLRFRQWRNGKHADL